MSDYCEAWKTLKSEGNRIRAAAKSLGCAEASLLECAIDTEITRLRPEFDAILTKVAEFGEVQAITRNEACVHEKVGEYLGFKRVHGPIAILNNPDIDLRFFMNQWSHVFASVEPKGESCLRSLQFFNASGEAVHKIYLTKTSKVEAFEALVAEFKLEDTTPIEYAEAAQTKAPSAEVDRDALVEAWSGLQDTHDFNIMLRTLRLDRVRAMTLAEGKFTRAVSKEAARAVLEWASESATPIMIFVGNKGAIQIHTGPIVKVVEAEGWLNVLDVRFNLHLKEEAIAKAWSVRKPTKEGDVHSLELFDEEDEIIAQLFSARKPGQEEPAAWQGLLGKLA